MKYPFYPFALWMALWAVSLPLSGCARTGTPDLSGESVREEQAGESRAEREAEIKEEGSAEREAEIREARSAEEEAAGEERTEEAGDRVLASVNAAADGGRTLRLDAIGKVRNGPERRYAIREVRVYEDGRLVQTILASESGGVPDGGYTRAPSLEEAMRVRDMNFDGSDDLDLFGQTSGGGALHHYWFWNSGIGRYLYALTLKGAEANPETGEVSARYSEDGVYYTDLYRPGSDGALLLTSRELEDWDRGTEDFPLRERYEYPDGEEILVYQEFTDYDDEGRTIREIRERVDGELIPVRLEELEVTDGSIRVIRTEEAPAVQAEPGAEIPEIPEDTP